jgi:hypothetical protein
MTCFPDPPILQFDRPTSEATGKTVFKFVEDYEYHWVKDGRTYRLVIPKGYRTDKASAPQFAWSLGFRPDGAPEAGAGFHDFLYEYRGEPPPGSYQILVDGEWRNIPNVWTRKEMDRLFGRLMRESGVGPVKRKLMYLAVRAFGWYSYHFGKR